MAGPNGDAGRGDSRHEWQGRRLRRVRLSASLAHHLVGLVEILAVWAGPHPTWIGVPAAEQKARAECQNSDPGNCRYKEPDLCVFLQPARIHPKHPSKEGHQKRHAKIADDGYGSPKPWVSATATRKRSDAACRGDQQNNLEHGAPLSSNDDGLLILSVNLAHGVGDFADCGVGFHGGEDGRQQVF